MRQLRQIHRSASEEVTKRLVTALVLRWLVYCNAVLTGLPEMIIRPLQRVQNPAACLITDTKPRDRITPVSDALTLAKITNSLQTVPPDAPHSHQKATCLHGRDGWTHYNIFVAIWPPVYQSPLVTETKLSEWAFSHAGRAAWNIF